MKAQLSKEVKKCKEIEEKLCRCNAQLNVLIKNKGLNKVIAFLLIIFEVM